MNKVNTAQPITSTAASRIHSVIGETEMWLIIIATGSLALGVGVAVGAGKVVQWARDDTPMISGTPPDTESWGALHPSGGAPPYQRRRPAKE